MIRFLLRWGVRLGIVWGIVAGMASSPVVAGAVNFLLFVYLLWGAWRRLDVDVRRLWRWTSFRSGTSRRGLRIGRLKGDTL